jgi:hypothetical protein
LALAVALRLVVLVLYLRLLHRLVVAAAEAHSQHLHKQDNPVVQAVALAEEIVEVQAVAQETQAVIPHLKVIAEALQLVQ